MFNFKSLFPFVLILLFTPLIYADNPTNLEDLNLYLNGTLGNIGTINNSGSYTNPTNAFDENLGTFADITTTSQISTMQYLGKTFPAVFVENLYFDITYEWSSSPNTLCGYDVQVLNDSGWHSVETFTTGIQCLNNNRLGNISLNYSIYGVQVGMRNTAGGGTSRTLKINEIIPYKTNINGYENYYNSSVYNLSFENTIDDNSDFLTFLSSESDLPSFNNGIFNGYVVNDGTCVNMGSACNRTSSVNSSFGNAISFDGIDDYIDLGTTTVLDGLNNISYGGWFNFNNLGSFQGVLSATRGTNVNNYEISVIGSSNQVRAFLSDGTGVNTNLVFTASANSWTHVIFTQNSSGGFLFVDGTLVSSTSNIETIQTSTNFNLGRFGTNGFYFNGSMDSVMIFDEALSQSEIQEQMIKTNPIKQSVANYNFDESNGTKVLDGSMFVQGNTTDDIWNRALAFNGSQYVDLGSLYNDWNKNKAFSWSGFIYNNENSNFDTFFELSNGTDLIGFQNKAGVFSVGVYDSSSYIYKKSGSSIINEWVYATISYTGSDLKLYLNNIEQTGSVSPLLSNTGGFTLGTRTDLFSSTFLNGSLDDIMIFNKSLTSQEIAQLYNNTYYNTSNLVFSANSEQLNNTIVYDRKTELCYNCSSVSNTFYSPVTEGIYTLWSFDAFSSMRTFSSLTFDYTNPIINNSIPSEINSYQFLDTFFSCQDTNLLSCNISIDSLNEAQNTNFTLLNNGNLSYTITAIDLAGNQVQESGVLYVNPNQYFRFYDNLRSLFIDNYNFGSYSSVGQYVTIPVYDLGLGNHNLLFNKSGYEPESFSFTFNTTSTLNETFNVTPATLFLRVFNELDITEQLTINVTILNSTTSTIYYNQVNMTLAYNDTITGDIEILIESENYSDRYFFTTFSENSSVSLVLYLMPTTSTDQVIFRTLNSVNENVVEEATLNFYRVISGNRIFIGQAVTDANGFTSFAMDSNLKYEIIITKDDFITQQFDSLPGRLDYTILLNPSAIVQTWLFKDFNYQFIPSSNTIDSLPFDFSVRYLDSDNLVSLATFTISGTGFSYSNSSTNANGDILNISVANITNKYTATLTIIRDGQTYSFNKIYTYYNESNYNTTITNVATLLDGDDNKSERYFMMIIGIVIFASLGALLGGASAGALAIIVPLVLYTYVLWMPISLSILLIAFIIMGVLSFSR